MADPSAGVAFRHDPTDVDALDDAIQSWSSELPPLGVSRVDVTNDGLAVLADVVAQIDVTAPVTLVRDATTITREGQDVRELVAAVLRKAGREVTVLTLVDDGDHDLHTTSEQVERVVDAVGDHGLVLTVGSGTVTDIGKHAAHTLDERRDDVRRTPLVFFPTANSVCAYGAAMAPVTVNGVKRTRPSRLPDAVVVDVPTLVDAPLDMTLAGIGDVSAMFVSYGDWYLHCRFGGGQWFDAAWDLATDVRDQLFVHAAAMGRREPEATAVLAKLLLLAGFSVSIPGVSAPLSGYEHVTGHLLDLQANHGTRQIGLHGLQVGTATLPCSVAFARLLDELDPDTIDLDACYPDRDERERLVRATFDQVDPSGAAGAQCWQAYADKLDAWTDHREAFAVWLADWPNEREHLRDLVTAPQQVARALHDAGVPTRWEHLPIPIPDAEAYWAFDNARLFRDRFSSADLLDFVGVWDTAFVTQVWQRANALATNADDRSSG